MENNEWNKFVKVFKLDVGVTVEKKVTRQDVILSLLNENEVAFKGKSGHMIMTLNDRLEIRDLKPLFFNPITDTLKKLKEEKKQSTLQNKTTNGKKK